MDAASVAKNAHNLAHDFVSLHRQIAAGQRVTPGNQVIACNPHDAMSC
jgi:hypothetical protein